MQYEIDFLPVGESHGDAICMRYWLPNGTFSVAVIDGGYADTGDSVVRHIATYYGTRHINNLILTHADQDHAAGLVNIMRACSVDILYMNRPWLYVDDIKPLYHGNYHRENLIKEFRESHEYLVELEELAATKGTLVWPIFQGTPVGAITVLAPSFPRYISLVPSLRGPDPVRQPKPANPFSGIVGGTSQLPAGANPFSKIVESAKRFAEDYLEDWGVETLSENPQPPTSDSNETSVVQMADFGGYRVLFTGDVGPIGLKEAADFAHRVGLQHRPNLFQIPHQGSRHNVTPSALDAWLGPRLPAGSEPIWHATCSVGTNKPGHPRKKVTNALLRRGYKTQEARAQGLCWSNFERPRWPKRTDYIPFHTDTREEDD